MTSEKWICEKSFSAGFDPQSQSTAVYTSAGFDEAHRTHVQAFKLDESF